MKNKDTENYWDDHQLLRSEHLNKKRSKKDSTGKNILMNGLYVPDADEELLGRIPIQEFPCHASQEELDIFVIYARISNLRNNRVPCIDCDTSYLEACSSVGKCRYPSAVFGERNGEMTLLSLGERVGLSLFDGELVHEKQLENHKEIPTPNTQENIERGCQKAYK